MSLPPPIPPGPPGPPTGPPWGRSPSPHGHSIEHPNGTTILVLGILSLVVCGLLGPVAWVMGNTAVREMNANPGIDYRNRGNVTAGRVCGIIGTVLLALGALMMVFFFIVMAGASMNG